MPVQEPIIARQGPPRTIVQVAYVVRDMESAVQTWCATFQTGPFYMFHFDKTSTYRGEPVQLNVLIALGYSGDLQIEFIQPLDDGPSIYRETLNSRGEGFHHQKWQFEDYDADVARLKSMGLKPAMWGEVPGMARATYFDALSTLGYFIELSEGSAGHLQRMERIKQAAREWDGGDKIRPFSDLG